MILGRFWQHFYPPACWRLHRGADPRRYQRRDIGTDADRDPGDADARRRADNGGAIPARWGGMWPRSSQ